MQRCSLPARWLYAAIRPGGAPHYIHAWLVAVGLGVALVPASMRRVHMDGVAYCDLIPAERPTVPLHLAVRRETGSAVLHNFVELVRRAAKEGTPIDLRR
jgi:DNA-binding transcriptional LysR family regulator